MVPLFAALVALAYLKRRRYFVEHLIFSLHFFAFFLILTSVGLTLIELPIELTLSFFRVDTTDFDWDSIFTYVPGVIIFVYLLFAFRATYGDSVRAAIIRSAILSYSIIIVMSIYRLALFFTTIYTMSTK